MDMETVSARELKNHTGEILSRVRTGASVVVTNRGRPVALLSPPTATLDDAAPPVRAFDEAWADLAAALAASEPEQPTWQEALRRSRRRP
jgi:prevent-host-death family protein